MVINRKKLNVCFHLKKDNIIYFSEPEDCGEERAGTELKKTNKGVSCFWGSMKMFLCLRYWNCAFGRKWSI